MSVGNWNPVDSIHFYLFFAVTMCCQQWLTVCWHATPVSPSPRLPVSPSPRVLACHPPSTSQSQSQSRHSHITAQSQHSHSTVADSVLTCLPPPEHICFADAQFPGHVANSRDTSPCVFFGCHPRSIRRSAPARHAHCCPGRESLPGGADAGGCWVLGAGCWVQVGGG